MRAWAPAGVGGGAGGRDEAGGGRVDQGRGHAPVEAAEPVAAQVGVRHPPGRCALGPGDLVDPEHVVQRPRQRDLTPEQRQERPVEGGVALRRLADRRAHEHELLAAVGHPVAGVVEQLGLDHRGAPADAGGGGAAQHVALGPGQPVDAHVAVHERPADEDPVGLRAAQVEERAEHPEGDEPVGVEQRGAEVHVQALDAAVPAVVGPDAGQHVAPQGAHRLVDPRLAHLRPSARGPGFGAPGDRTTPR